MPSLMRTVAVLAGMTRVTGFVMPRTVSSNAWRYRKLPVAQMWRVEDAETAAGNPITLVYEPDGKLDSSGSVAFLGGFNGWDGEDGPGIAVPVLPRPADGIWVACVPVPEDAKTVEFLFSDGTRFDTDDEGQLYRLRLRHVQERDERGDVRTYVQEEDGTLVPTGLIPRQDSEELEHMIQEELERREQEKERAKARAAAAAAATEVGPGEGQGHAEGGFVSPLSKEAEAQLHVSRAESGLMADRLGIGRLLLPAIRDAFGRFEDRASGALRRADVGKALEDLGFDLVEHEVQDLVQRFGGGGEAIGIASFMEIYADLDSRDEGIQMV